MVDVAVGDSMLEPGPESKDDKLKDAKIAPGRRTFQFNVPWGGALLRLGDGGLPRRAMTTLRPHGVAFCLKSPVPYSLPLR